MSREARVLAQAKINLFLRVLARESSGYHQLETLFCRLALADGITVRADVRGRTLDCRGPSVPEEGLGLVERNLAWRAAEAFADACGWPGGFAIEIDKHIPVGGGLGGGSADAGAVLRALNALAPAPLSAARLLELAGSLGADIPFLTLEAPLALAWGRGERMLALEPLPEVPVILVAFRDGVPTKDAYAWLDESRLVAVPAPPGIVDHRALSRWEDVAALAHNDFEDAVRARHALVDEVLTRFRGPEGAELFGEGRVVLMSGSGATVFVVPDATCRVHVEYAVRSTSDEVRWIPTRSASAVVPVELVR